MTSFIISLISYIYINIIYLYTENSVSCYIHQVSPDKKSKKDSSVHYYNCLIQSEDGYHRSVSYSMNKRSEFESASKNKSPVKLTNVKRKQNIFHQDIYDIEINNKTMLEPTTLDFPCQDFVAEEIDSAPLLTVRELLDITIDRKLVSVIAHVNILNRPVVPIKTRYSFEPQFKKDVTINDDTGIIKLTLWNEIIQLIPDSATYQIEDALINEYPKGVISISTCSKTKITKMDQTIEPSVSSLPELKVFEVRFPPASINSVSKNLQCPVCKKCTNEDAIDGKIFKCGFCKNMTIASKLDHSFTIRMRFRVATDTDLISITMFGDQVVNYLKQKHDVMPDDSNEMAVKMLQDDRTTLLYDKKFICIGMH